MPTQGRPRNEIVEAFYSVPVVTRILITATASLTLACKLTLVHPYTALLWWPAVIRQIQVWRLATTFLLAGTDWTSLFVIVSLARTSYDLETSFFTSADASGRPRGGAAGFCYFLTIVAIACWTGSYILQLTLLQRALSMAVTYLWAQTRREQTVSFMFGIRMKALYLPAAITVLDVIVDGPQSLYVNGLGCCAGHIYLFFDTFYPAISSTRQSPSWWGTPKLYKKYIGQGNARVNSTAGAQASTVTSGGRIVEPRGFGTSYRSRESQDQSGTSNPSSGHRWQGRGQKLGSG